MAIDADKLTSALELEARAHQELVNIGEEFKTIHHAKRKPDEDEIRRLRKACQALVDAGKAVDAAIRA